MERLISVINEVCQEKSKEGWEMLWRVKLGLRCLGKERVEMIFYLSNED